MQPSYKQYTDQTHSTEGADTIKWLGTLNWIWPD